MPETRSGLWDYVTVPSRCSGGEETKVENAELRTRRQEST